MKLCDNGHDEVCYESRNCPVCIMESQKDKEIQTLGETIDDLKNKIEVLENT